MGNNNELCSLEQEMSAKLNELEAQRQVRRVHLVDLTLEAIARRVESQESVIAAQTVAAGKPLQPSALRQIVVVEVVRAADGNLWCDHYSERAKSDQQMNIYVGTHWERIDSQQWMDFIDQCALRCGLAETHRMNPTFMNQLYEGVAFNLKKHRRQMQPRDEVWLNMPNGTLVVTVDGRVTLREHSRDDLFFYCLEYSYDPQADCPLWQQFLDRVQPTAGHRRCWASIWAIA